MCGEWAVRRLARRLKTASALRGAVWWAVVALLTWGSAVVAARLVWPVRFEILLCGIGLVILAALLGAVWATRQVPSQERLLELLDAENNCGGLLMSGREITLDGWAERVNVARIPDVAWNKRKALLLLACSVTYVGLALFLPQRFLRPAEAGSVAAEREIEKLQQQLEKLRELGLVEEQRYAELQSELQQVRKNASAEEPGKTQEALDHLEQALKQLAKESLQKRQEERELLQQAKDLAEALRELSKSEQLQPGESQLASQLLEKLLKEMMAAEKTSEKAQQLKEFLEKHQDGNPFSDKELEELAKLLDELLDGEALDLGGLADLDLIDPEWLKNLKNANVRFVNVEWLKAALQRCEEGECDAEELLALLIRCRGGTGPVADANLPGRGGVNRGRADAELTFGQQSSAEGVQFKPEALKPGALHNLDAPLVKIQRVKPGTEQRETSQGGALGDQQGVGEGHERQILPRHRKAVRQYFDSGR